MPWTMENPPDVAKNWTDEEKEKCVKAANAVLENGGTDEAAIFACIHAAGKSEEKMSEKKSKQNNAKDAANSSFERRYMPMEFRIDEEGIIEGYAAVFNQWSADLGGFIEMIRPGAFAKTLQEADVRGAFNHDANYVLGRNKSGTLELQEDDYGLKFRVDPPETQWADDLRTSIKRGDIDQASFAFNTIRDKWTRSTNDEPHKRELIEVQLFDVGPVTYPAYPQTSVSARNWVKEAASTPGQEPHLEVGQATGTEKERTRSAIRKRRLELDKLKKKMEN